MPITRWDAPAFGIDGQGQVISSTRAATFTSVTTTGNATVNGTILAAPGIVTAPGISFSADADTGVARLAENTLALVAGGVAAALVGSAYIAPNTDDAISLGIVGQRWSNLRVKDAWATRVVTGGNNEFLHTYSDTETLIASVVSADGQVRRPFGFYASAFSFNAGNVTFGQAATVSGVLKTLIAGVDGATSTAVSFASTIAGYEHHIVSSISSVVAANILGFDVSTGSGTRTRVFTLRGDQLALFELDVNVKNAISVGTTGVGTVSLHTGASLQQGFIAFTQPNGTRSGYIGFSTPGIGVTMESGNFSINRGTGQIIMNLPTASPGVAGALWNNAGVVNIS